jgi:predicted RNase H-like HicB family nuclease
MIIKAVVHEAQEGGHWAEIPALPGCFTEGETLEELAANIKEAATGFLAVLANSQGATAP